MPTETLDTFYRGDTWSMRFDQIVDRDGVAVSDLSGWSARWTLRQYVDSTVLIQRTTAAGHITVASVNTYVWEAPTADTALLAPGTYVSDIELTDPSGRIATVRRSIEVEADISV